MARILLTGATGFLGHRLVAECQAAGHEVVAISRDPARARAKLGDAVACHGWDHLEEPFPAEALEGVSIVYHLMGENIGTGRWSAAKKRALRSSRIESTRKLVRALPDSVTDFLCASAIGIYPGDTHLPFDEDTPRPPAQSFMAELCEAWEGEACAAASESRRVAMLRIGLVLGESGMLRPLLPLYRLGLGGPLGDGRQRLPWVHVDDCVEMMRFVEERRDLDGPVNLVGPESSTLSDFSATLARVLGRPHVMRVPGFAVRLAMGEAAALVLSSYAVRPTRLVKAGYAFRHDTLDGALEDVVRGASRSAALGRAADPRSLHR